MEIVFLLLLVMLVLPIFLNSRRQRQMQMQTMQLQQSLQIGDEVMTSSGMYGTIVELDEETVDLEVSPGVYTTWTRHAIKEKVEHDGDDAEASEADEAGQAASRTDGASGADDTVDNGQTTGDNRG